MQLGILGLGQMGDAIVRGLIKAQGKSGLTVLGSTRTEASAESLRKEYDQDGIQGIQIGVSNREVVRSSKILLLAVKPHHAEAVLSEVSKDLKKDHLLISICAAITTQQLSEWSGGKCAIIRAMPNTPCLIQEGMTAYCYGPRASAVHEKWVEKIFAAVGRTARVDESLMDGVTGLSGCGPAYVYMIIEALSEAGVKIGLPRSTSTLLAAQTLLGASRMVLSRGVHPAALKDEVTTPAGCTIDGLMALEEGKLRVTLIKGVLAATRRSQILGKK
jgi:pyrroline-5-carboxylate reductase